MAGWIPLAPTAEAGSSRMKATPKTESECPQTTEGGRSPTPAGIKQHNTLYVTKTVEKIMVLFVLSQIHRIGYRLDNQFPPPLALERGNAHHQDCK